MTTAGKHERINQKMRTRRALLQAAYDLLEDGHMPTVADAADRALVSRATAYRYFPSQDALLAEAPLGMGFPSVDKIFAGAPADPEDRIALAHNVLYDQISARETLFRQFMRQALARATDEDGTQMRPGHRIALIDTALEDIADEIDPERLTLLKRALGIIIGTEAMFAMRDVLHLEHEEARAAGEWAVRRLVRSALAEA